MRRLIAAWRHRREVRDFDRAWKRGVPVDIVTPPGGIKVRVNDWITDETLTTAEKMRRFEALHPQATRGAFVLTDYPPTLTTGSTSTYTWRTA